MRPSTILYEASVKVPGSKDSIHLRALANNKHHAKQLMMNQLQSQAREKARKREDGAKVKPLYLDESDIRELA